MNIKACPIETSIKYIGKKWSINILRDLFRGKKRFIEFLKENPKLSTKMLSARLKELEKNQLVEKRIIQKSPIIAVYHLTEKGRALKNILYELSIFSINQYSSDVFADVRLKNEMVNHAKKMFNQ